MLETARRPPVGTALVILVAHELRSYRQTIARALKTLRPNARVIDVEPEQLEAQAKLFSPHVVICTRATPAVRRIASSWVELYREHNARVSFLSVAGERSRVAEDMELGDLLSIIDRTSLP